MPLGAYAAICGFLAVALGAFGAHGLKPRFTPEAVGWWETATFYLLAHAVAALALALAQRSGLTIWAGGFLLAGAAVFAATLYAMALGAPRWFGAITPLGGLGMLLGWALLAWALLRASPS